jgi:hypothetical protein
MKLIIEKQPDGGMYAYTMSNKRFAECDLENDDIAQLAKVPQLEPDFLDENCNLHDMDEGYIVFDIKRPQKMKKKKKKKKKVATCSLQIQGRHVDKTSGRPSFVASLDQGFDIDNNQEYARIRIDDENHPEFWMEVMIIKD